MTTMADIFGAQWEEELSAEIDQKFIRVQTHYEFSELHIANYTEQAAYQQRWNQYTLQCRGLIWNDNTGEVLARPLKKFFNYGAKEAPVIDLDVELYWVGDKYDGSMGVVYIRPDGDVSVATRGSFDSVQARHANSILTDQQQYEWLRDITALRMTPITEIIFPENRIVVDYGARDELVPLGWVSIQDGHYAPPEDKVSRKTMRDVLSLPERPNAEGWVIWTDWHTAVKLKQADYVAMHAIVTGLSEKAVWRALMAGGENFESYIAALPDELQDWAEEVAVDYRFGAHGIVLAAKLAYDSAMEVERAQDGAFDRSRFARYVSGHCDGVTRGYVFSILDGKDIKGKALASIEPVGLGRRPGASVVEESE